MASDGGEIVERNLATPAFPYVIRYRVTSDLLAIMAVHHQHRHPGAHRNSR